MMEQSFMPRSLWTNDSKFLHHHVTDFFTSVQVTQDIPAGTSFGPCVLHNTFYDTIAFIALKSFDKREKSYVFRVDPEAMKSSPLVVPWLRFVQAAMNTEEQNTEAYLKSGQLYFRTIRDVRQGEELLVWYDEELSHLLGFSDVKQRSLSEDFLCGRCGQVFKNENPFLAHCRFLCTQVKTDIIRTDNEHKQTEVKRQRKVTDFHNIARDLEHKKSGSAEDNLTRKRKPEETLSSRNRKTVLLEKTNITNHKTITDINKSYPFGHDLTESTIKSTEDGLSIYELKSIKSSSNTGKPAEPRYEDTPLIKDATRQNPSGSSYQSDREAHMGLQSDSSAFSFVLPGSTHEEQKSAFCKPNKRITDGSPSTPSALCGPQKLPDVSEPYNSKTVVGYRNLLASHLFQCDLPSTQTMVSAPLTTKGSFHFTHEHWSTTINGQLPANPSLTILPPTFSSLGVSVQNWCAKCNLSFRMTSDLVFHMRSHHKKEFSAESQVRRRREEKLTCPICNEYFRERHHLSRHMTSHN